MHRAASSYMAENMKTARHLRLQDYAGQIYRGETPKLEFKEEGYIYGPLRYTTDSHSPVWPMIQMAINNIKDHKAIFMVRNPIDHLASWYHIVREKHSLSPVKRIAETQLVERELCKEGLQVYLEYKAQQTATRYGMFIKLYEACPKGVLFRYEDMVRNPAQFRDEVGEHIQMKWGPITNTSTRYIIPEQIQGKLQEIFRPVMHYLNYQ